MTAKPDAVEGGCCCNAIRYKVTFPSDYFTSNDRISTCQCEQCRKTTGTLFFHAFKVPISSVTFQPTINPYSSTSSPDPPPFKRYQASPEADRGFCSACGSFLYWHDKTQSESEVIQMTVGTIDQKYLAEYGEVLSTPGLHLWCEREIKGVTDAFKGEKWKLDNRPEGVAEKMPDST